MLSSICFVLADPLTQEDMKNLRKRRHIESIVIETYMPSSRGSVSLIGVHLDQFITKRLYTGVATYIAVRGEGGVGGYGVFGPKLGISQPISKRVFFDSNFLIGGAGGGGMPIGGGFVIRLESGLGFKLSKSLLFKVSGGYFRGGSYRAPLVNFSVGISSFSLTLPMK